MTMSLNGTSGLTMPGGQTQVGAFTSGTAVASTSGTSIDFTSIPSWVKRVTVLLSSVSTNGTSQLTIQLGAGSVDTALTYLGAVNNSSGSLTNNFTGSFQIMTLSAAAAVIQGKIEICLFGSNIWVMSGLVSRSDTTSFFQSAGSKTLSGTLDRVRITTAGGTETFDAGSINILYE